MSPTPSNVSSPVRRLVNNGRSWNSYTPAEQRMVMSYSSRNKVGGPTSLSAVDTADLDSVADNHGVEVVKEHAAEWREKAKRDAQLAAEYEEF